MKTFIAAILYIAFSVALGIYVTNYLFIIAINIMCGLQRYKDHEGIPFDFGMFVISTVSYIVNH